MDYVTGWCLYLLAASAVILAIGYVVGSACAVGTIEPTVVEEKRRVWR